MTLVGARASVTGHPSPQGPSTDGIVDRRRRRPSSVTGRGPSQPGVTGRRLWGDRDTIFPRVPDVQWTGRRGTEAESRMGDKEGKNTRPVVRI